MACRSVTIDARGHVQWKLGFHWLVWNGVGPCPGNLPTEWNATTHRLQLGNCWYCWVVGTWGEHCHCFDAETETYGVCVSYFTRLHRGTYGLARPGLVYNPMAIGKLTEDLDDCCIGPHDVPPAGGTRSWYARS